MLVLLYSSCPFKPQLFSVSPGQINLLTVLQHYPFPLQFDSGSAFITRSLPFLPFSARSLSLLLCRSCSISPQFFFRRKCCIDRGRFGVSVEKVKFRVFLCHHLGMECCIFFFNFSCLKRNMRGSKVCNWNKSWIIIQLGNKLFNYF